MPSLIQCPDPIVLQEICDHLNELQVPYFSEVRNLEIMVKSDPSFLEQFLAEHGFHANVIITA